MSDIEARLNEFCERRDLKAEIERLRGLLTRMLQWDQFNPPMTGDHASWKRQIQAALEGAADQPDAGRAYYETHEPPHCPTCECGADNSDAVPEESLKK